MIESDGLTESSKIKKIPKIEICNLFYEIGPNLWGLRGGGVTISESQKVKFTIKVTDCDDMSVRVGFGMVF